MLPTDRKSQGFVMAQPSRIIKLKRTVVVCVVFTTMVAVYYSRISSPVQKKPSEVLGRNLDIGGKRGISSSILNTIESEQIIKDVHLVERASKLIRPKPTTGPRPTNGFKPMNGSRSMPRPVTGPRHDIISDHGVLKEGRTRDLKISMPSPLIRLESGVTCERIINGFYDKKSEELKNKTADYHRTFSMDAASYTKLASNCTNFVRKRRYVTSYVTEEERNFPIAYSILMYKDMEQVERLLRAIYRPQNYYCIHVDSKTDQATYDAMAAVAGCFSNVFMASLRIDVQWGATSMYAEMVCIRDLAKYKAWKYFINLTGQEFPLRTNKELVEILKILNGGNILEGTVKRRNVDRTMFIHHGMTNTGLPKLPPPINVTITKGAVHIIVQRGYIDYIVHNESAQRFFEWVMQTALPDETYFSSLNFSPQLGIPGSFTGEVDPVHPDRSYAPAMRFKFWQWDGFPCQGKHVRAICVYGMLDLPRLTKTPRLIANKFFYDLQPLALDCLEEWFWNKTRTFVETGHYHIDEAYYRNLVYVKHHLP